MDKRFILTALLMGGLMLPLEASGIRPELKSVHPESLENQGVHGDAIVVIYTKRMLIPAKPHPLAGGMEDVNNVPGSEKKATAEYPHHQGNVTGRNVAKNYLITITPAMGSKTTSFQGTWADLGGTAIYHPSDPNNQMILLLPPSKTTHIFTPGDIVEITVVTTVSDPEGNTMHPQKNHQKKIVS